VVAWNPFLTDSLRQEGIFAAAIMPDKKYRGLNQNVTVCAIMGKDNNDNSNIIFKSIAFS
jgi:hypothetical protein